MAYSEKFVQGEMVQHWLGEGGIMTIEKQIYVGDTFTGFVRCSWFQNRENKFDVIHQDNPVSMRQSDRV
ncbi:hypothetical protein GYB22_06490 [bacterium]|nr:hypothetical protein [bacterium]